MPAYVQSYQQKMCAEWWHYRCIAPLRLMKYCVAIPPGKVTLLVSLCLQLFLNLADIRAVLGYSNDVPT